MTTILIMASLQWLWGEDATPTDKDLGLGTNDIRYWPEVGELEDIDYVLIWGQHQVDFNHFANLKGIFSLGAGIDHLGDLSQFRSDVPLVRLIDPLLTEEMVGYVLLNVLRFHRLDPTYREQQNSRQWKVTFPKTSAETRIGIAGAGQLGSAVATTLAGLGYNVACWSQTKKDLSGIHSFAGKSKLSSFLGRTDILVSLLPLTQATRGLWNAKTFAQLPSGAYIINAGRGATLNEADLLSALSSGKIAGAALDVFSQEPLPEDHPLWSHKNVFITPHAASLTHLDSATAQIKANIERIENKNEPLGLVDLNRGY